MIWLSVCLTLLSVFFSGIAYADPQANGKILFKSSPSGATVCKKVLDREECFGRTPLSVDIGDEGTNSSHKFIVKKIGYGTHGLYVDQETADVSIALKKQDIFFDPDKQKDAKIRDVQRGVNERLSKLIYSSGIHAEPNFELVGQRTVYRTDEGIVLAYPVLINSYEALRELKRAGRVRDRQKRYASTLGALNDAGVFSMFDDVLKAIAPLPLDKVLLNVMYTKSGSVLDIDQVQQFHRRHTGSYYTSYGSVTHKVDSYETYATTKDVTVVRDKVVSVDYSFIVDKSVVRSAGAVKFSGVLDKIEIVTNDTPNGKYGKIEIPPAGK